MARATTSQPFEYPTPVQLDAYRGALSQMPGTETPLFAPQLPTDGSYLGAPSGVPMVAGGYGNRGTGYRLAAALAIRILGADAGRVLFPPQQPLQPIAQPLDMGALGRKWDFPPGWNTRITPRTGLKVGFPILKALSEFDLVRIMIERVKDEVTTMSWSIGPRDKKSGQKGARDADMDAIEDMLAYPDRAHTWYDWTKLLLEQVIVYDAPALWLRPTYGGDLYSIEILDGSKFAPKIMADGRIPPPEFGPAYQQVLHGLPAVDYIQPVPKGQPIPTDPSGQQYPELLYKPRSPRVDIPYGYSACEWIIRTIEIATKREDFLLDFYTAGSIPDMMVGTPDSWNPDMIAQFQAWFDSVLVGNLANRRGVRFLPGGKTAPYEAKKEALTDATDEWVIRILCFGFGLSPMPFVKMMNRASGQTHAEQQKEEGTLPYASYIADLFNHLIRVKYGRRDLVFRWDEEESTDPVEEATRFKMYTDAKVYHPDEVRAKLGEEPMSDDMRAQMDMPNFAATVTATVLPPDQQQDEDKRNQDKIKAQAALAPKPGPGQPPAPGVAGKVGKGLRGAARSLHLIAGADRY